eukprot:scaffold318005_cov32-Tisochrysis_lutea.AAC.2
MRSGMTDRSGSASRAAPGLSHEERAVAGAATSSQASRIDWRRCTRCFIFCLFFRSFLSISGSREVLSARVCCVLYLY